MLCTHCSAKVNFDWESVVFNTPDKNIMHEIHVTHCPNCEKLVVKLSEQKYSGIKQINWKLESETETMIYPSKSKFQNIKDIPKQYLEDYEESLMILSLSPKASAALNRRLLQSILREEFKIQKRTLAQEIAEFIDLPGIPSHITDSVDALRNIGNFAAHPTKDINTGEIVPVENGEAEWLIEVIEALFDFVFIQPKKIERRRKELNIKLEKVGKPQMKAKNKN
ncbi:DUF4145 domain-containing protein [Psychroserpens ponticola]|uniref:DUF4145 domain-containing protein n=1 Tax=Psychroserpens ponticola TaxID=2932268 RepID=A0ABY7S2H6_9FLAO|nr:DUF4145 domain-containing protein [Psychroserpens ponticola]WCO03611.1 DUF4145 domain-containing protein [Psychroserpens ponticola]